MEDMKIQLRLLQARLKAQEGYIMNVDMRIAAGITKAEISELEAIIAESKVKRTSVDFKKLRDAYFNEHVTHKTTDGIPMVCTHPHNLFEWFKAELKEYGC